MDYFRPWIQTNCGLIMYVVRMWFDGWLDDYNRSIVQGGQ